MSFLTSNQKQAERFLPPGHKSLNLPPSYPASRFEHHSQKRADCNSLDLLWFRRHPDGASQYDQDLWAKNAFAIEVSPYKYTGKIAPADTEGDPPEYWETRVSKDGKWRVGHDRHYKDGKVALTANAQTKWMDVRKFKHFEDKEDGYIIVTNHMWECLVWY